MEQPPKIKKPLYAHQLISIKNMLDLEFKKSVIVHPRRIFTKIGILSDLTGYGKTLSMLGLISKDPNWEDEGGIYIDTKTIGINIFYQEEYEPYEKINCSLVILNSILLSQWENEINNTTLTYKKITTRRDIDLIDLKETDILLCDSQYYNLLRIRFCKVAWKRVIIDEPNTVKIADNKMICNFIWFITATPYILLEKNKYPNILGSPSFSMFETIIVKNEDDFVKKSFQMPPNTMIRYMCRNVIYDILKNGCNIQKNIEDLAVADNISGLLEYLGGSRDSCNSVIDLILKRKLAKLDEIDRMLKIKHNEKLYIRYQTLSDDIKNLSLSFKKNLQENNCSICLDSYTNPSLVSCCQNIFCGKCIAAVLIGDLPKKCPLCRNEISAKNIICIEYESSPSLTAIVNKKQVYKTKSQTIIDIIIKSKSNKKGKFIIYSDYTESFDTLKRYMEDYHIKYTEMKGVKSQREKSLENYRVGDVNVLLLTTLQYSAGIDLINTTDIILYHDMSESIKTQIIGRANRIGRMIPLSIHCMF